MLEYQGLNVGIKGFSLKLAFFSSVNSIKFDKNLIKGKKTKFVFFTNNSFKNINDSSL